MEQIYIIKHIIRFGTTITENDVEKVFITKEKAESFIVNLYEKASKSKTFESVKITPNKAVVSTTRYAFARGGKHVQRYDTYQIRKYSVEA